ncbi:alpha/beta hydrolase [Nocardia acidivorans]|uniref:alpha/beta hydrolase n=1 Tax=Nocardia acidivorans TaxID=404580 RepID=UPI00082A005D|nr:lipase family protein [Nocardia acidivorans]
MRRAQCFAMAALVALLGSSACSAREDGPAPVSRGEIVATTPIAQMSAQDVTDYLTKGGIDTPVRNGVESYRVVYRTIAPDGAATTASGLVVLPRTDSRHLRVVSYEHGTLAQKNAAPSVDGVHHPDQARTIMFAAVGYAAVAPDYLGLGEGPGTHPYTHAPSEASAGVDLLRAARTFTGQRQRELDNAVLVTGFSQGGHAATALAKALQSGADPGFGLAALAPISGPYDVQHVETPAGLDGRVGGGSAVYYFAYWVTAMNRIYHLYDKPSEAFQEPYAEKVEGLFDGLHDDAAIVTQLPAQPNQLLTQRFMDLALNPTGQVLKAMTESDGTCDWTPRVPVRLYAATGDRNVPYANAEHCLQALHSDNATLTNLGDTDHNGSVRAALPGILAWFQQALPAT